MAIRHNRTRYNLIKRDEKRKRYIQSLREQNPEFHEANKQLVNLQRENWWWLEQLMGFEKLNEFWKEITLDINSSSVIKFQELIEEMKTILRKELT